MKLVVYTPDAPAAIGPYSQAVCFGKLVFCSGQIPLSPKTMKIIGLSAKEQTEQVMKNIGAVLQAAHSSFSQVLKCSIFLHSMDDFSDVNEVYGRYFPVDAPARETIAVRTLPKNVLVEISCIASVGD